VMVNSQLLIRWMLLLILAIVSSRTKFLFGDQFKTVNLIDIPGINICVICKRFDYGADSDDIS